MRMLVMKGGKRKTKYGNHHVYECDSCGEDHKEVKPIKCRVCHFDCFTHYDSWKEFLRWRQLQLLEKGGIIRHLKKQVRYPLNANNEVLVGYYVSDSEYIDLATGNKITEDVKSEYTEKLALFKWKHKHFQAQYGREIKIFK